MIPDTVSVGDAAYFVTGIGQGVFAGTNKNDGANTTLTSVTMGANVKHIGSGAFQYCSKLTTVDFPKPPSWSTLEIRLLLHMPEGYRPVRLYRTDNDRYQCLPL